MKIPQIMAFFCALTLCSPIYLSAAPIDFVENTQLTLLSKARVDRSRFDYTYEASFTNNGNTVENLVATLSSNNSAFEIIDGESQIGGMDAGESATSADTVTIRIDRRIAFDPGALSWVFDADQVDTTQVTLQTSPQNLSGSVGELVNIASSLAFETETTGESFTIEVEQSVTPNSGILLSPSIDGSTFVQSNDFATVFNQEITLLDVGQYTITTTASIQETGQISISEAIIVVSSETEPTIVINTPTSDSGALSPDTVSDVEFVVQIHGLASAEINSVVINGSNNSASVTLNDDGIDGDLVEEDNAFSGTLTVSTLGMASQQCLTYVATVLTDTELIESAPYSLCVSSFPIGPATSDTDTLVDSPTGQGKVVADELLISFVAGTSEAQINTIVSNIGGSVVGFLAEINLVQVKLSAPTTSEEIQNLINTLSVLSEVEFVEANYISEGTSVSPSDSRFIDQDGIKVIRADEAWNIARGNVTIAIIDSGADLNHPDLNSKVIKGKDYIDGGDPEDENGHGTHVAGIAAAQTNNGIGIAGVSWNSKLLIVRVLDKNKSGNVLDSVAAILHAANKGARIINLSLSSPGGNILFCSAISYARLKGALVVSAAGNDSSSTKVYPGGCSNSLTVGNTTNSDSRNSSSNFGSWVDLAAPGTNILSTVPTGTCTLCDSSGYRRLNGTSMSSPMVAGAAAVLLSRENLTNSQIEERLKKTAKKLPGLNLGAGRIDLFEAVFNGSFEEGNLALWTSNGTVGSFMGLGPLTPQHRERMGYISTGPAGAQTAGGFSQSFQIQDGVTSLPITFTYAFISEEFPEFVGSIYDDSLVITLVGPSGTSTELARESINSSSFSIISGLDFPGGDSTVGWTGWKTVTKTVSIADGPGTYRIVLEDAGDAVYDTVLLIDNIQFK